MTTAAQPASTSTSTATRAWAPAITRVAQEFPPTPLPIVSGCLPDRLRGTLYRNGPARLQRGSQRMGHWFDGDGAILGVRFGDMLGETGATATYRYVQTEGLQAEEEAGRLMFANYGMLPPGWFWERFTQPVKNVANTSVIALPDRLLALWEGGEPHALDLDTLDTKGLDDLGKLAGRSYSAHPKRDPITGEIYNFGVSFGKDATLNLYRSDRTGRIQQENGIALEGLPLIHDFVMAGEYLVFAIPPVQMQVLPALLRLKSFSDALQWQPQRATQILICDRRSLKLLHRLEAEPWYQWHFGNGAVEDNGAIALEISRYEDFQTNQFLKEVATGYTQTPAKSTLWQLRLDPKAGKVLEMAEVYDRTCEFPIVAPHQVGQPWRYTYLSLLGKEADTGKEIVGGAIARFDRHAGTATEANLGDKRYGTEPIYAPDPENGDRGWILTVVYDGDRDRSEVWVFDAAGLDSDPVCRLELPGVVPMGFHGTWNPA